VHFVILFDPEFRDQLQFDDSYKKLTT